MLRKVFPAIICIIFHANTFASKEFYGGFVFGRGQLSNKTKTVLSSASCYGGISGQSKLSKNSMVAGNVNVFPIREKKQAEYLHAKNASVFADVVYKKTTRFFLTGIKFYANIGGWGSYSNVTYPAISDRNNITQHDSMSESQISDIADINANNHDLRPKALGIVLGIGVQHYNLTPKLLIDISGNVFYTTSSKIKTMPSIKLSIGYRMSSKK